MRDDPQKTFGILFMRFKRNQTGEKVVGTVIAERTQKPKRCLLELRRQRKSLKKNNQIRARELMPNLANHELQRGEEETYVRERDHYELEKGRVIREMKRFRDEDGSRFNNYQISNHRYALLNLPGKGDLVRFTRWTSGSHFLSHLLKI